MATRPGYRPVVALMGLLTASLAVIAPLHLTGTLAGGSKPFEPTDAGVAEAVICLVLGFGAVALARGAERGRSIALATVVFAIAGFVVGLTFTIQGGDAIDVAYHATVLPLLVVTLLALSRFRTRTP